jgi:hypothetical protein
MIDAIPCSAVMFNRGQLGLVKCMHEIVATSSQVNDRPASGDVGREINTGFNGA